VATRRPLEFGISVVPTADDLERTRAVVRAADWAGLELLGIQDHPYQRRFLETWMLMATLLAETERIRIFPDVANLPLRLPAMIAKAAASTASPAGGSSSVSAPGRSGTGSRRWGALAGVPARRCARSRRR
jgi:alkanesulfonate monooxygenase SsuD/methylene tetrahydromethanopterin reductase-like flavin-dependent oxidoreductase (luciferase family)